MTQVKEVMCRYLVEEESSACGSSEACGDELSSVGQDCVTVGTREQASPSNVIQEDTPHFTYHQKVSTKTCKQSRLVNQQSKYKRGKLYFLFTGDRYNDLSKSYTENCNNLNNKTV